LADLQAGGNGLVALSSERSPTVWAARAARANVLSDHGRNAEALILLGQFDPKACQVSTSDPGRDNVLRAIRAPILLRLGRRDEGDPLMREALKAIRAAGVSNEEVQPFDKFLRCTGKVNPQGPTSSRRRELDKVMIMATTHVSAPCGANARKSTLRRVGIRLCASATRKTEAKVFAGPCQLAACFPKQHPCARTMANHPRHQHSLHAGSPR
jgi:hypothetical protein